MSTGPLPHGDAAGVAGESLGVDVLTAPGFGPLPDEVASRTRRFLTEADVVVLADPVVSPGMPVLSLLDTSQPIVLAEERPLASRNFAGKDGERVYERLRDRSTLVDGDGVDVAIERALRTPPIVSATD